MCIFYTIIGDSMVTPYLEPAASVVTICGGIEATARLVKRDRSVVNRWLLPKDKGGTGGMIPMHHAQTLLASVPKLRERHFFVETASGGISPAVTPEQAAE